MDHKLIKIGHDFEFKAKLKRAILEIEALAGINANPEGGLIYDGKGANATKHAYLNTGTAWRKLLMDTDSSSDSNFTNEGDKLPTRTAVYNFVSNLVASAGSFIGPWDASGGALPTGAQVKKGDYYRITQKGTVAGLLSGNPKLAVGDIIVANKSNPAGAADYFALQANFADANDIAVGPTFTPANGTITESTTLHEAVEILLYKAQNAQIPATAFENAAGDGLKWTQPTTGNKRYDVDLAPNSGLALTANDGSGKLTLKGLADLSAKTNNIPLGYDGNGDLKVNRDDIIKLGPGLSFDYLGRLRIGTQDWWPPLQNLANSRINLFPPPDTILVLNIRNTSSAPRGPRSSLSYNLLGLSSNGFRPKGSGANKEEQSFNHSFRDTTSISHRKYFVEQPGHPLYGKTESSFFQITHSSISIRFYVAHKTIYSIGFDIKQDYALLYGDNYPAPPVGKVAPLALNAQNQIVLQAPVDANATPGGGGSANTKKSFNVTGDGSTKIFTITHNKNTKDLVFGKRIVAHHNAALVDTAPDFGVKYLSDNQIQIVFNTAPLNTETYRVTVI